MRNIWPSPHVWWVPDGALLGLEWKLIKELEYVRCSSPWPPYYCLYSISHCRIRQSETFTMQPLTFLMAHVNGIDFKLNIWRRLSSFYCFVVVRSCILLLTMHNCCVNTTCEGNLKVVWWSWYKMLLDVLVSYIVVLDWQSLPIKYSDLEWDFACDTNRNEMTKQNVLIVSISLEWKIYT